MQMTQISTSALSARCGNGTKSTVMFLNHHGGGCQRSTSQHDERFLRIQAR